MRRRLARERGRSLWRICSAFVALRRRLASGRGRRRGCRRGVNPFTKRELQSTNGHTVCYVSQLALNVQGFYLDEVLMFKAPPFDRQKHVYMSDAFVSLVKDAIRFFNGTPVYALPRPKKSTPAIDLVSPSSFVGSGVYAIYYTGSLDIYRYYSEINREGYNKPIYIGKAVPSGWRQGRTKIKKEKKELFGRMREHWKSIDSVNNLSVDDFFCRFVIFDEDSSDMIGTIEAALIKKFKPLWNVKLDGFGNHDPGSGRYEQAKSDWDIIHPGREWADKCVGVSNIKSDIEQGIANFFAENQISQEVKP